jgi:two-component system, response regulator, stage 0 sporulation protein F
MPHTPHVLLAEDDADLRESLSELLAQQGYRVTEAVSGDQLLERLWERSREESEEKEFDLIVSDVHMPGLNGVEVLEGLRDDFEPSIGQTPIIFITGFGDRELQREAKDLRAAVFAKPLDVDQLLAHADLVLSRKLG